MCFVKVHEKVKSKTKTFTILFKISYVTLMHSLNWHASRTSECLLDPSTHVTVFKIIEVDIDHVCVCRKNTEGGTGARSQDLGREEENTVTCSRFKCGVTFRVINSLGSRALIIHNP